MPKVKGGLLINRLKYLREKTTPEQQQAIFSLLNPDCHQALTDPVLPINWYPLDYLINLMEAMEKVLDNGTDKIIEELGCYSAHQAYHGIYKLFFNLGSPEFIIKRCPTLWKQLVDKGKCVVTITGSKQASFSLCEFDTMLPHIFVRSLAGWSQGLLEVSGAKHVRNNIVQWPTKTNFDLTITLQWA